MLLHKFTLFTTILVIFLTISGLFTSSANAKAPSPSPAPISTSTKQPIAQPKPAKPITQPVAPPKSSGTIKSTPPISKPILAGSSSGNKATAGTTKPIAPIPNPPTVKPITPSVTTSSGGKPVSNAVKPIVSSSGSNLNGKTGTQAPLPAAPASSGSTVDINKPLAVASTPSKSGSVASSITPKTPASAAGSIPNVATSTSGGSSRRLTEVDGIAKPAASPASSPVSSSSPTPSTSPAASASSSSARLALASDQLQEQLKVASQNAKAPNASPASSSSTLTATDCSKTPCGVGQKCDSVTKKCVQSTITKSDGSKAAAPASSGTLSVPSSTTRTIPQRITTSSLNKTKPIVAPSLQPINSGNRTARILLDSATNKTASIVNSRNATKSSSSAPLLGNTTAPVVSRNLTAQLRLANNTRSALNQPNVTLPINGTRSAAVNLQNGTRFNNSSIQNATSSQTALPLSSTLRNATLSPNATLFPGIDRKNGTNFNSTLQNSTFSSPNATMLSSLDLKNGTNLNSTLQNSTLSPNATLSGLDLKNGTNFNSTLQNATLAGNSTGNDLDLGNSFGNGTTFGNSTANETAPATDFGNSTSAFGEEFKNATNSNSTLEWCTIDEQCSGSLKNTFQGCDGNVCLQSSVGSKKCSSDSDCASPNLTCDTKVGICNCRSGLSNSTASAPGSCTPFSTSNCTTPCSNSTTCVNNACVALRCGSTTPCPDGSTCEAGFCKENASNSTSAEEDSGWGDSGAGGGGGGEEGGDEGGDEESGLGGGDDGGGSGGGGGGGDASPPEGETPDSLGDDSSQSPENVEGGSSENTENPEGATENAENPEGVPTEEGAPVEGQEGGGEEVGTDPALDPAAAQENQGTNVIDPNIASLLDTLGNSISSFEPKFPESERQFLEPANAAAKSAIDATRELLQANPPLSPTQTSQVANLMTIYVSLLQSYLNSHGDPTQQQPALNIDVVHGENARVENQELTNCLTKQAMVGVLNGSTSALSGSALPDYISIADDGTYSVTMTQEFANNCGVSVGGEGEESV